MGSLGLVRKLKIVTSESLSECYAYKKKYIWRDAGTSQAWWALSEQSNDDICIPDLTYYRVHC
jgi:hypothetical protein